MFTTHNTNILCTIIFLCILLITLLNFLLKQKNKKQLHQTFIIIFGLMLSWLVCMIFQLLFMDKFNINIKYFFNIYYISLCFLPVAVLFMALSFERNKVTFKRIHLLLFIIPILSIILMWTNDFHHLFYKEYSTDVSTEYGWYFYVHTFYTYFLFAIALLILIKYAIKNSGFFSKQAILILIGALVPLIVNLLGSMQIIQISIYTTPITFAVTIVCFTFAIFKFDLFKITPIALQRIVDRISDSYVVLNENHSISDFNETFLKTFLIKNSSTIRGKRFEYFLIENNLQINSEQIYESIKKVQNTNNTDKFELYIDQIGKYFDIEISSIISNNHFLGILVLFKDITQHKNDMQTIQDNQSMLIEKERLASLGQMIGGIAHNLKTPIFSISGGLEGLNDLIEEYDSSIEDPTVNDDDMHAIAQDMRNWIDKLKTHVSYMSDVITAVKGQAVTLSNENIFDFTVEDLFKQINILMKHELKHALINFNVTNNVDNKYLITGNINSLVQVINNIISNAIEAYNKEPNKSIDLSANVENNKIIIVVKDYGPGIPENIKNRLFKEMITTKGKNGTGLGLFMSYSTIKAHFHGEMTLESQKGVGTSFIITLPIQK